jgi:hypothetical protein
MGPPPNPNCRRRNSFVARGLTAGNMEIHLARKLISRHRHLQIRYRNEGQFDPVHRQRDGNQLVYGPAGITNSPMEPTPEPVSIALTAAACLGSLAVAQHNRLRS